jgi:hypothetical protein
MRWVTPSIRGIVRPFVLAGDFDGAAEFVVAVVADSGAVDVTSGFWVDMDLTPFDVEPRHAAL